MGSKAWLVALSWYDFDFLRPKTDQFWDLLKMGLEERLEINLPAQLNRYDLPKKLFKKDHLLLAQACGLDLIINAKDNIQAIATPIYQTEFSTAGKYCSLFIANKNDKRKKVEDFARATCAINETTSHSGMNAFLEKIDTGKKAFFSDVILAGSHATSLKSVAFGVAEIAAIDCISFQLLTNHDAALKENIKILELSEEFPCPPFVTSMATDTQTCQKLFDGISHCLAQEEYKPLQSSLLLSGVKSVKKEAYEGIGQVYQRGGIELLGSPRTLTTSEWKKLP